MFKQVRNTFIGVVVAIVCIGSLSSFRYFIDKQTTDSLLTIEELNEIVEKEINQTAPKYHFIFIGGCDHQLYVNNTKVEQLSVSKRREIVEYLTSKIVNDFDKGNTNLYDIVSFFPSATYEADDKKPTDCGKIWSKSTWDL